VQRSDGLGLRAIKQLTPVAPRFDEPNAEQDTQMLGHRRLWEAQFRNDIIDRTFAGREELQYVSPTGLGYRIEGIGGPR
jgi:hypothetical protein